MAPTLVNFRPFITKESNFATAAIPIFAQVSNLWVTLGVWTNSIQNSKLKDIRQQLSKLRQQICIASYQDLNYCCNWNINLELGMEENNRIEMRKKSKIFHIDLTLRRNGSNFNGWSYGPIYNYFSLNQYLLICWIQTYDRIYG